MKKVMGRPKIGIQAAKGKIVAARFSPPEYKEIDGAVKRSKLNKTQWVRSVLLSAAKAGTV
ncbi:MAG TPA: hypothetical protein VN048_18510 [Verrucomicrobiae bacterium]|jgi:hypothetical protein|nr:hypothetical protein [Verrucomicrobiae bacterium]